MRLRNATVLGLAAVMLATTGCAAMSRKFTFMRPDVSKREFTRTAPVYNVRSDEGRGVAGSRTRVAVAEQRLRAGQLDEAESNAKAALKLDSRSADANTILALVADQRGHADRAGAYYAKAAELSPAQGGVNNNYGAWLCGNGRAVESLAYFDRALADRSYGTPLAARANAGACAVDAGQLARAERDLRFVLAQDPSNAVALAAMARHQFATGRYLDARAFIQRRLAAGPATPEIVQLASQIEQKLGDGQAAAQYSDQSGPRTSRGGQ